MAGPINEVLSRGFYCQAWVGSVIRRWQILWEKQSYSCRRTEASRGAAAKL